MSKKWIKNLYIDEDDIHNCFYMLVEDTFLECRSVYIIPVTIYGVSDVEYFMNYAKTKLKLDKKTAISMWEGEYRVIEI